MASSVTSTYDLTTVAAVVRYLGGDPTVTVASYPLLQALITAVSRQCSTYCSRDFRLLERTESYNGVGGSLIILNLGPVIEIASVGNGAIAVQASTGQTAPGFTNDNQTLYYRGGSFAKGVQNVVVTYTAGFVTPGQSPLTSPPREVTLPEDLQESVIEAVALRWRRIPNEDKNSISIADQTTSFVTSALPATVKAVWDAYKPAMLW